MSKEAFPELGDMSGKSSDKQVLKKDMGYQMSGGSSAAAAPAPPRDDKPKMPVFFGRAKLNVDSGTTAEEVQNSKQNYDMSRFNLSQATSKTSKPQGERGEGRGRGRGGYGAAGSSGMDDDFEVVTDKKRLQKKTGSSAFDNDFETVTKPSRRGGRHN